VSEYAIFQLDPDGYVTSWNRGAEAIQGYAAGEIIGQHFSVFYTADDARAGAPGEALERAARDGQWIDEAWRVRKSGERFWAHVTITALYENAALHDDPVLYDERTNGGEDPDAEDTGKRRLLGFAKVTRDMTERRRREKALNHQAKALKEQAEALDESEEKFRALAEKSLVGIAMLQEGVYEYVNPKFAEITGYERDELIGHPPAKLFHPSDRDYVRRQMQRRLAGEIEEAHYEAHIVTKSDETRTLEVLGSRLIYQGKPAIIGMMRDITKRKKAEEALSQSERRYRRLFETSQEAIVITTPGGTILDANPAACALNGYAREELIGMDASTFYSREAREELVRRLQEYGQVQGHEVRMRRKDGVEIICQVSATVWRDAEGEVEAIQSFARDVTEERRARQALEESEAKFRTLAEQALVGIAVVQDGVVQYANPAYAEVFGFAPGEIVGRSPRDYIETEDWVRRVEPQLERLLAGKIDAFRHTSRARTKTGDRIYIEGQGGRITYEGRPALLGMVRDITAQRRLQREVVAVSDEERRRIGQDLHDMLASQLAGTAMMTSALADKIGRGEPITSEELRKVAKLINEAGQQARALSHSLMPLEVQGEGLTDGLHHLAKRQETMTPDVTCSFEAGASLPALSSEIASHLYRIASEAVNNALKHADPDAIAIRLAVKDESGTDEGDTYADGSDERLELVVQDDGVGIPADTKPTSGLGLHMMQYRSELIGATLEIDRAETGGTLVRCQLPLERIREETGPQEEKG
jgi:hypothetical protein